MPLQQRRNMVSRDHVSLSILRQCEVLDIHRSGIYYQPNTESELNLKLMRLMDEHFLEYPFKGAPQMFKWLKYDKGFDMTYLLNCNW